MVPVSESDEGVVLIHRRFVIAADRPLLGSVETTADALTARQRDRVEVVHCLERVESNQGLSAISFVDRSEALERLEAGHGLEADTASHRARDRVFFVDVASAFLEVSAIGFLGHLVAFHWETSGPG